MQGKLLFSTFLTRKEGKKRLGCYQQEELNLPREYSVFDGLQSIVNFEDAAAMRKSNKQ